MIDITYYASNISAVIAVVVSLFALVAGRGKEQRRELADQLKSLHDQLGLVRGELSSHVIADTALQTRLVTTLDQVVDRFDKLLMRLPSLNV